MLRKLYDWTMGLAARKDAVRALGVVSFAESSFFPIPPDVLLIPMILAQRERAWYIATVCTVCSVLGGLLGYAIGFYLYETVGLWLIDLYGMEEKAHQFRAFYDQWGLWVILIKGLTPIPFKLVTIVSGAAHFNIWMFFAASIVTRGARFFIVAALLRRFGLPIRDFIERQLTLVFTIFLVLLLGGFWAVTQI